MAAPQEVIDPGHTQRRAIFRLLGPAIIVVGILLLVTGAIQMFSPAWKDRPDPARGFMTGERSIDEVRRESFQQFNDSARTSFTGFALVAAGMVCLAVGAGITRFGYMGAVARYTAEEIAPVGVDTINYVGRNAQEGIRDVSEAIREGIQPADSKRARYCTECGRQSPPDAKFCSACGHPMQPR